MIQQDKQSWDKGRADAMRGVPSKCPKGLDALAYSALKSLGRMPRDPRLRTGHDLVSFVPKSARDRQPPRI